uniref:OST-HTH associated domain-containing protein n=1 Tax=Chromera velia CCMP2878 TaxID=1169474 RepID=A0A0G4GHH3_9ALVE|eukprot:Cvel_21907.t1-p1 / transcript=Cvel_21907.t1 / gene=Cvel_21907 / organism=Chromera_velia_CCMP2878 / gene_product=hypothetical protein / transcript_product=hypothetical protein / location=Cvel_scaffold2099:11369-17894(-) / protein_length=1418 / sequence_SO=supercontig / SO=protein_coding / is_pseudo=false
MVTREEFVAFRREVFAEIGSLRQELNIISNQYGSLWAECPPAIREAAAAAGRPNLRSLPPHLQGHVCRNGTVSCDQGSATTCASPPAVPSPPPPSAKQERAKRVPQVSEGRETSPIPLPCPFFSSPPPSDAIHVQVQGEKEAGGSVQRGAVNGPSTGIAVTCERKERERPPPCGKENTFRRERERLLAPTEAAGSVFVAADSLHDQDSTGRSSGRQCPSSSRLSPIPSPLPPLSGNGSGGGGEGGHRWLLELYGDGNPRCRGEAPIVQLCDRFQALLASGQLFLPVDLDFAATFHGALTLSEVNSSNLAVHVFSLDEKLHHAELLNFRSHPNSRFLLSPSLRRFVSPILDAVLEYCRREKLAPSLARLGMICASCFGEGRKWLKRTVQEMVLAVVTKHPERFRLMQKQGHQQQQGGEDGPQQKAETATNSSGGGGGGEKEGSKPVVCPPHSPLVGASDLLSAASAVSGSSSSSSSASSSAAAGALRGALQSSGVLVFPVDCEWEGVDPNDRTEQCTEGEWRELVQFMAESLERPQNGRHGTAMCVKQLGTPQLRGLSLGQLEWMVQLSLCRGILVYDSKTREVGVAKPLPEGSEDLCLADPKTGRPIRGRPPGSSGGEEGGGMDGGGSSSADGVTETSSVGPLYLYHQRSPSTLSAGPSVPPVQGSQGRPPPQQVHQQPVVLQGGRGSPVWIGGVSSSSPQALPAAPGGQTYTPLFPPSPFLRASGDPSSSDCGGDVDSSFGTRSHHSRHASTHSHSRFLKSPLDTPLLFHTADFGDQPASPIPYLSTCAEPLDTHSGAGSDGACSPSAWHAHTQQGAPAAAASVPAAPAAVAGGSIPEASTLPMRKESSKETSPTPPERLATEIRHRKSSSSGPCCLCAAAAVVAVEQEREGERASQQPQKIPTLSSIKPAEMLPDSGTPSPLQSAPRSPHAESLPPLQPPDDVPADPSAAAPFFLLSPQRSCSDNGLPSHSQRSRMMTFEEEGREGVEGRQAGRESGGTWEWQLRGQDGDLDGDTEGGGVALFFADDGDGDGECAQIPIPIPTTAAGRGEGADPGPPPGFSCQHHSPHHASTIPPPGFSCQHHSPHHASTIGKTKSESPNNPWGGSRSSPPAATGVEGEGRSREAEGKAKAIKGWSQPPPPSAPHRLSLPNGNGGQHVGTHVKKTNVSNLLSQTDAEKRYLQTSRENPPANGRHRPGERDSGSSSSAASSSSSATDGGLRHSGVANPQRHNRPPTRASPGFAPPPPPLPHPLPAQVASGPSTPSGRSPALSPVPAPDPEAHQSGSGSAGTAAADFPPRAGPPFPSHENSSSGWDPWTLMAGELLSLRGQQQEDGKTKGKDHVNRATQQLNKHKHIEHADWGSIGDVPPRDSVESAVTSATLPVLVRSHVALQNGGGEGERERRKENASAGGEVRGL